MLRLHSAIDFADYNASSSILRTIERISNNICLMVYLVILSYGRLSHSKLLRYASSFADVGKNYVRWGRQL